MKSIGELVHDSRVKKRISLEKLEEVTKIKKEFIQAIEKEDWAALPPFPTVLGFVKSIASPLGIGEKMTIAILKRDYPPKSRQVANPKPDISAKFVWSPKLTFAVGVGITIVAILGYLIFQYSRFISPPTLKVEKPQDGEVVTENFVLVSGATDTDSQITVNNQPVLIDQDGKFSITLEIVPETSQIVVKSISRSGKETVVVRNIKVEKNN